MRARVGLLVSALSVAACATTPGPPSKPVAVFPSPAALAAVEARRVEVPVIPVAEVPAEGWTAEPARAPVAVGEPWTPQGAWDRAFAEAFVSSKRPGQLTRALACAAEELGRFHLEHGAAPPEALQRFMNAACGAFTPSMGYRTLQAPVSDGKSDEQLLDLYGGQLRSTLVGKTSEKARGVGFWFGRANGRFLAVATYDTSPVELQPFAVVPDASGDVTIEGRLLGDAAYFGGEVNQGRYGVRACHVDPSIARPRFRVTCRMSAEDETAWMQIVYAAPNTVLALPIAQILLRRDATEPLQFREVTYAGTHVVSDAAAFRVAAVAGLNAVRIQAHLLPVRLSAAESDAATRVSRQYFASSLGGGAAEDMNTVALGLLAGWQVQGTIRGGTFFAALVPRTRDVGRWLDYALAMPIGRETLMKPDIEEVAFGPAFLDEPAGVGAVVAGYQLQHGNDHSADAAAIMGRLAEARARSGKAPPRVLGNYGELIAEELQNVQRGEENPRQALDAALYGALRRYERSVRGYVIETSSVDAFEIPYELLMPTTLDVAIGVAHYKPPGAAWAQLVIVIVYASTMTFVHT